MPSYHGVPGISPSCHTLSRTTQDSAQNGACDYFNGSPATGPAGHSSSRTVKKSSNSRALVPIGHSSSRTMSNSSNSRALVPESYSASQTVSSCSGSRALMPAPANLNGSHGASITPSSGRQQTGIFVTAAGNANITIRRTVTEITISGGVSNTRGGPSSNHTQYLAPPIQSHSLRARHSSRSSDNHGLVESFNGFNLETRTPRTSSSHPSGHTSTGHGSPSRHVSSSSRHPDPTSRRLKDKDDFREMQRIPNSIRC